MKWKIIARTETDIDIIVVIDFVSDRCSYMCFEIFFFFSSDNCIFLLWSLLLSFASILQAYCRLAVYASTLYRLLRIQVNKVLAPCFSTSIKVQIKRAIIDWQVKKKYKKKKYRFLWPVHGFFCGVYIFDRSQKKRWLEFRINFEMEFCVSWNESLLHVQTCASSFSANCSLHSTSHYYLAIKFNGISPQVIITLFYDCFLFLRLPKKISFF